MAYAERAALKQAAKEQLKGNLGTAIGVMLVFGIVALVSLALLGLGFLILGTLVFGFSSYFLNLKRKTDPGMGNLFSGFGIWGKTFGVGFFSMLFTWLWSLLFLIPGIIKAIGFSQAYFILKDNPELTGHQAVKKSEEMMKGHKGRYFVLLLSFFWWIILTEITAGLAGFYVIPYVNLTLANFYDDLKANQG